MNLTAIAVTALSSLVSAAVGYLVKRYLTRHLETDLAVAKGALQAAVGHFKHVSMEPITAMSTTTPVPTPHWAPGKLQITAKGVLPVEVK